MSIMKSLPWRAALAAGAGAAAVLALALPAGASTGTVQISPEHAGYTATNAQFKTVSASVYLRNPEQYATQVAAYGHSVQLWSSGLVMVLGVSDTTATGSAAAGFSPAVAVFNRTTHALVAASGNGTIPAQWCPAGGTCQPATSGGSFATGVTVTQRMHYNPATGAATFNASDAAGDLFTASYTPGMGISFTQARIGTEFGSTPWDASYSYTPPAGDVRIATYNTVYLTTYSGHTSTLWSWWVRHKLLANTGQQTSSDWVAVPTDLYNGGASFQTWFVPMSAQSSSQPTAP